MIPPQAAIVLFARCLASAASTFLSPRVITPFLLLSAVESVALLGYAHFTHPLLAAGAAPAVAAVFGEGVLHYPMHVWYLPIALDWIRCVAAIVPGTVLFVWAAKASPLRVFTQGDGERRNLARLAPLFATVAAFALVLVGVQRGVGLLEAVSIVGRLQPVWIVLSVIVRPLLFVALAEVVFRVLDEDRGGMSAVLESLRDTATDFAVPVLLALTGALLLAPTYVAVAATGWFVDAGTPGFAASAALISLVWDAPVLAFLFSAAAAWRVQQGSS